MIFSVSSHMYRCDSAGLDARGNRRHSNWSDPAPWPISMPSILASLFCCLRVDSAAHPQPQPPIIDVLPAELQILVAAQAPTGVQWALCLVSRRWHAMTLPALYSIIEVDRHPLPNTAAEMFVRSVIAKPALGAHVLSLNIYFDPPQATALGLSVAKLLAPALHCMPNLRHLGARTLQFALTADPYSCKAAVKSLTNLQSFESASPESGADSAISRTIAVLPPLRRVTWDQLVGDVDPEVYALVLRSRHILEHLDITKLDANVLLDMHDVQCRAKGVQAQCNTVFPCLRSMNVGKAHLESLGDQLFPKLEWLGVGNLRNCHFIGQTDNILPSLNVLCVRGAPWSDAELTPSMAVRRRHMKHVALRVLHHILPEGDQDEFTDLRPLQWLDPCSLALLVLPDVSSSRLMQSPFLGRITALPTLVMLTIRKAAAPNEFGQVRSMFGGGLNSEVDHTSQLVTAVAKTATSSGFPHLKYLQLLENESKPFGTLKLRNIEAAHQLVVIFEGAALRICQSAPKLEELQIGLNTLYKPPTPRGWRWRRSARGGSNWSRTVCFLGSLVTSGQTVNSEKLTEFMEVVDHFSPSSTREF